ncbi:MAG: FTR1 family protein, partial [Thermoproteota archaeon]|nr:FTR1 family protein [Thermoproteota archaeon]
MTLDKHLNNKYKRMCIYILLFCVLLSVFSKFDFSNKTIHANQHLNDADALIFYVNLERIRSLLDLSQLTLNNGEYDSAFTHSYVPHAVIFPTIKGIGQNIDPQLSSEFEAILTDLPLSIKQIADLDRSDNATNTKIIDSIQRGRTLLLSLEEKINPLITNNSKPFYIQSSITLLDDSLESYNRALPNSTSSEFNPIEQQNSIGFLNVSRQNFEKVTMDQRRSDEVKSFYDDLLNSILTRQPVSSATSLADAIKRDYNEELSIATNNPTLVQYSNYFNKIRSLLEEVKQKVNQGDYRQADRLAIQAYLDNYEYLEAPIEKIDPELMLAIEIDMREELREMIKANNSTSQIIPFVDNILNDLNRAENLLKSDPTIAAAGNSNTLNPSNITGLADITGLSQGFGSFQGERRSMGETTDDSKQEVRNDIDTIRTKLNEMLSIYQAGNVDGALFTARSAYLDSYEKIELPLRPIDPDFTLDMEIKFAELRNLLQSKAPYSDVLSKTVELRNGLDESERLVSGTGTLAPTIAFSSSFSIIFREGLESALILGAITTYLEASRNDRYKKHVYYGIVLALGATAVTWFVAEFIIDLSGASRELIEAIAGISAVAVLFWVSFWVLNKIETKKWIEFVKAKVWQATATGSVMVFVMLSFFTVYREGFETVLFYQAMLSFAKYMELYVVAGMVVGTAVIVSVAIIVKKLGKRLPLRVLFAFTMGVGAYMSIAFMGNAIREFQEVGYLPLTPLFGIIPRLDINTATMTGIHPTLETIVAQVILLSVYIVGSLYVLVI